jgi:hypothetical protein
MPRNPVELLFISEIMRQLWSPLSNKGFGDLFVRGKSPKVSVFGADFFQQWHDSISFHEFINPPPGQRDFSKILEYLPLRN